jgi:hypothetical protein
MASVAPGGIYASRNRFFELVLNNQYMGVYVFFEKVKRGKNRVNIDKLSPDEITGDALTGGYILKLDKTTGGDGSGFNSNHDPVGSKGTQKIFFQYEYPKSKDIALAQQMYIIDFIKKFEDALASDQYNDPVNGWTKYADMSSFVDYLIINELTKNPDAYRLSTFMYKQKDSDGGKLFMGPIWDFNIAFGNVNYCTNGGPTGLVIDFNSVCPGDDWQIPFWWQKLWSDLTFRLALSERWKTLRQDVFSEDAIIGYVDSVTTVLNMEAQQRNFKKWPVIGVYVWPNYKFDFTTYNGEVDWMKHWIRDRLTYLDSKFDFSIAGVNEATSHNVTVNPFPNPFDRELIFDYEIPAGGVTRIEMFDVLGRNAWSTTNYHDAGGHYSAKAGVATPGVYLYRVIHNDGRPVTGKVVRR